MSKLWIVAALAAIALTAQVAPKPPASPKKKPEILKPECNPKANVSGVIVSGVMVSAGFGPVSILYRCSPEGFWVEDEEATQRAHDSSAASEKSRTDLIWALRTRIATAEEMKRVEDLGRDLFMSTYGGIYDEVSLERLLNEILLQQFRLRHLAAACKCP